MGREVIEDDADLFGLWIMDIGKLAHAMGEVEAHDQGRWSPALPRGGCPLTNLRRFKAELVIDGVDNPSIRLVHHPGDTEFALRLAEEPRIVQRVRVHPRWAFCLRSFMRRSCHGGCARQAYRRVY
jgi:hypothetical protein